MFIKIVSTVEVNTMKFAAWYSRIINYSPRDVARNTTQVRNELFTQFQFSRNSFKIHLRYFDIKTRKQKTITHMTHGIK